LYGCTKENLVVAAPRIILVAGQPGQR